jgi:predicted amidophosphoribosyltransferase
MISYQLSFLTSSWFPSRCFICRHLLNIVEQSICQVCLQSLPRAHTAELTKLYILGSLIDADFVSALIFTDPVNTICYGLKYGDHPRLGGAMGHHVLGPFLVEHLKSRHRTTSTIVLIPMPISKRRRFQRGYNQCHSISKGCQKALASAGIHSVVLPLLRKEKHRKSQVHFSAIDRWSNISNSLRVRKKKQRIPKDALLVVIDDTVTTGSSLFHAGETLRENYPETLLVLASLAVEV